MSTSSSNRPPPDEESSRTAETDRLVEGIEKTRSEMSGAMAALESRFSPDNLRGKVEGELHHVEEKVREVVKEQLVEAKALIREGMNEAESKIKHGLSEVRLAVKQDLADQLDDTEAKIRKGLADAKDSVKTELREAFTGAKQSVRAATLGRVEDLATTIGDSMNTTRETIVETVRNNPIPAALAGFGIAWLLMSRSSAAKRASGNAAR